MKAARRSLGILGVLIVLVALFVAPAAAQTAVPGGDVSGAWTLADSPILIEGSITVPAGQTLVIEPGVEVIAQSWYKLTVNGTLVAEGTEEAPIRFGATDASPGWLGIRFVNASPTAVWPT